MTYYELIKDAEHKLNFNKITLGEYEEMIEPLKREIEQQPCEYEPFTIAEVSPEMRKLMEEWQKPCDDAISRAELLRRIDAERTHLLDIGMDGAEHVIVHHARRIIEDLPSVTPKPKMGEWIKERHTIRCDKCNAIVFTSCDYNDREEYREMVMDDYIEQYKYCPECGARMNGGGEE